MNKAKYTQWKAVLVIVTNKDIYYRNKEALWKF